jgi:hypothetical protein
MASKETIIRCFEDAAESFGYPKASVDISEFRDLKIRWERTGSRDWIHFRVTDYLEALSDPAVYDLADGLMRKITGEGITAPDFSRADVELSSPEFAARMQARFLRRNGLRNEPEAWGEYVRMAEERGVALPEHAKCFLTPEAESGATATFRVAAMGEDIHGLPMSDQIRWIDSQMVRIAKGLRDCNAEGVPDRFVEVE